MRYILLTLFVIILIPSVYGSISNIDKLKWDWVAVSPNHLEFDQPDCQHFTVQPTFRVTNSTTINMEIFSREYANGVSTGHIFKLYGSSFVSIRKEEIKTIMVCADFELGSVPRGTYEATLVIESVDRVYQIPLTLRITTINSFMQGVRYKFNYIWFKEIATIPTLDGTYLALLGYHFLFFILSIIVFIWCVYLFYIR